MQKIKILWNLLKPSLRRICEDDIEEGELNGKGYKAVRMREKIHGNKEVTINLFHDTYNQLYAFLYDEGKILRISAFDAHESMLQAVYIEQLARLIVAEAKKGNFKEIKGELTSGQYFDALFIEEFRKYGFMVTDSADSAVFYYDMLK